MQCRWWHTITSSLVLLCSCVRVLHGYSHEFPSSASLPSALSQIQHVIVLFFENQSFDSLFGTLDGVEGIPQSLALHRSQLSAQDQPISSMSWGNGGVPASITQLMPAGMTVQPFNLSDIFTTDQTPSLNLMHMFYHEQAQMNATSTDGYDMSYFFTYNAPSQGFTMGYWDLKQDYIGQLASNFTVLDHFFHSGFGGSMLNHFLLIGSKTPPLYWSSVRPPPDYVTDYNPFTGEVLLDSDNKLDNQKHAINDFVSCNLCDGCSPTDENCLPSIPSQTASTMHIGDSLDAAHVSWKWYSEGWTEVNQDTSGAESRIGFVFHHQPFAYYSNYSSTSMAKSQQHLFDESSFFSDLSSGQLPNVSYVKPLRQNSFHPAFALLSDSQQKLKSYVNAVQQSIYWKNSLIILAFDENGGFYDHVPPYQRDSSYAQWGPGTRVPAVLISPLIGRGVLSQSYETQSIVRLLESKFGLQPLIDDPSVNNLFDEIQWLPHLQLNITNNPNAQAFLIQNTDELLIKVQTNMTFTDALNVLVYQNNDMVDGVDRCVLNQSYGVWEWEATGARAFPLVDMDLQLYNASLPKSHANASLVYIYVVVQSQSLPWYYRRSADVQVLLPEEITPHADTNNTAGSLDNTGVIIGVVLATSAVVILLCAYRYYQTRDRRKHPEQNVAIIPNIPHTIMLDDDENDELHDTAGSSDYPRDGGDEQLELSSIQLSSPGAAASALSPARSDDEIDGDTLQLTSHAADVPDIHDL